MKKDFFSNLADNKILFLITSLASLISFFIAIINQNFLSYILLTITITTLLFLIRLISINSNFISELDNVNLYVFDSSIELEIDENENYVSDNDVIIGIHTHLSPKTFNMQPQGEIKIVFPSQLKINFYWRSDQLKKINETNDSCTFSISLKSGMTFISLRAFAIKEESYIDFLSTQKCLEIHFNNNINPTVKVEKIFISTVG